MLFFLSTHAHTQFTHTGDRKKEEMKREEGKKGEREGKKRERETEGEENSRLNISKTLSFKPNYTNNNAHLF